MDTIQEVKGFLFSAVSCGLKRQPDQLDLALIFSETPASVAGVFTTNVVAAAPVVLDRERLKRGSCRAILANSGCANACTGPEGYQDAVNSAEWVACGLRIEPEEVMVASTGVIGTRLPLERIKVGIPQLIEGLSPSKLREVACAIMTTDTKPKYTVREFSIGNTAARIGAVVKGAGMIHPRMATMLCFAFTDACISSPMLQRCLNASLKSSFHSITVDGDTSTNDTVLVLANGASGSKPIEEGSREEEIFFKMLEGVLRDMALEVVRDGEGATKLVHIQVEGAPDDSSADAVARTIAHSPLVKTSLYGQEVNWGRILAAAGRSGVTFSVDEVDLFYEDVQLLSRGRPEGKEAEIRAGEVARRREFTILLRLGEGKGRALIHTCDLSHGYVEINGRYKT